MFLVNLIFLFLSTFAPLDATAIDLDLSSKPNNYTKEFEQNIDSHSKLFFALDNVENTHHLHLKAEIESEEEQVEDKSYSNYLSPLDLASFRIAENFDFKKISFSQKESKLYTKVSINILYQVFII